MKTLKFIIWALAVLTISHFAGCNIEPVEGKFEEASILCLEEADLGKMRAKVDSLDFHVEIIDGGGNNFEGCTVFYHDNSFYHLNIQVHDPDIGSISLVIIVPEIGVHDLVTPFESGSPNTNANNHDLLTSAGAFWPPGQELINPYVTYSGFGGSGEVEITAIDLIEGTASGNFSFIGKRSKKDPETGEVILDANGEPIIESMEVNCGFFNEANFNILDAGGGEPGYDFFTDFYANVDGEEFVENSVIVDLALIDDTIMHSIIATTADGRLLRIDIPADIGTGTFDLEPISNGTQLTAVYNNNTGSEGLTPNPGTITITEFNGVTRILEGSFSFTGTDPLGIDPTVVEITEGAFKLTYSFTQSGIKTVSATVDGLAYESDFVFVLISDFLGTDILTVSALTQENESIGLIFPKNIEEGSYPMYSNVITGNESVGLYSPLDSIVTSYRSNPGTFTILDNNLLTGEIEGAFEYEAVDIFNQDPTVYSLTNGSFYIFY